MTESTVRRGRHLLVYISGHGYGHVAQIAPVLNQLRLLSPTIRLTICSAVPEAFLRSRIAVSFSYIRHVADFGMLMQSALEVDTHASVQAYLDFHADWEAKIVQEVAWIKALEPDAILSNVAYLPLAAASQLGLPAFAMCSLNWADVLQHYAGDRPDIQGVLQQIRAAYAGSQYFLRTTPSMPMPWLTQSHECGPVADLASNQRSRLLAQLGKPSQSQQRLVLVSMGGISTDIHPEHFPVLEHVQWLLPQHWLNGIQRADFHATESLGESFSDILASCDLVLTKPGYGTFVEAACHGIPVLYVERDGWPEQDCLITWLQEYGVCRRLVPQAWISGEFSAEVLALLALPKPSPVQASGNREAARFLIASIGLDH
ncbi:hypothetical protein LG201_08550 [Methylobacillus gramineus]|uniref:hypothetical protein n=1 Tax=Methylobacillus gramineus TaxID=755169 RepID=UPI001CFF5D3B|nr:hypothetical protein [Methylobacillus gramineus]MCB5185252.1 hypothetical protein [Methylobacillus gramineus]